MGLYFDRLRRTAGTYLVRARRSRDGGWGPEAGSASDVIATAEVLTVLRSAGVPPHNRAVRAAASYLRDTMTAGLRAESGERPVFTLHVLGGLLGLAEARDAATNGDVIRDAVAWIAENRMRTGAWSEQSWRLSPHDSETGTASPAEPRASLLLTELAVRTFGRLRVQAEPELRERLDTLTAAARVAVRTAALPSGAWAQGDTATGHPAATAVAVLTLAGGAAPDREKATGGARWLARHRQRWVRSVHPDPLETAPWTNLTYALGARALLSAGGSPHDPAARNTLDYLARDCWHEEVGEWREGRRGPPTTRASNAAVLTYEAARLAFARLDPTDLLVNADALAFPDPFDISCPSPQSRCVEVAFDGQTERVHVRLSKGRWAIFRVMAGAHPGGLSLGRLAAGCDEEPTDSFRRAVQRLDLPFRRALDDPSFCIIGRHGTRWVLLARKIHGLDG